ncbi:MAG: rod shape-determining protein MreC [bacterium]|nr:rod shape-determining protein MreC [bacterium]
MPNLRRSLSTLVLLFILLLILPTGFSKSLRGLIYRPFTPLLRFTSKSSDWFYTRYYNLTHIGELQRENGLLKSRVVNLEQQVVGLAAAASENETLRQELGITNRPSADDTVAATIISRTSSSMFGEALIDAGQNVGVAVGQPIMAQGIFVGRVKEVFAKNALITLINSPDAEVQAMLTDSGALGLVNGGPTGLHLTEIDQGITIREGEIVQTSGLGGTIPKGLVIGQVDRLISDRSSSKQEALLRTTINFNQLRLVFVILRTPPQ